MPPPIIITTTTALLGALPLCFTPLGVSIVGSLIVSQAVTLYTTPTIFHYLDRLGLRLRPGRGGAAAGLLPLSASAPPTSSGMISSRRK